MFNPIVSILTTVYNREKFLADCIESVLNSEFEDWELIIVDDQSNDNSVTIVRGYAEKDDRILVYENETNLGDYPNRNRAASYAKGKYLKYLDADDMIYPHGLGIMVRMMEANPSCGLGISQDVAEDCKPYPFVLQPRKTFQREFLQRGVLGLGPTGTIIRRDAFEKLGGFSGTRYIGDTELWYKLALQYPILKMVPGLTFWRKHEDQEITKGQDSYFYLENSFKLEVHTLQHPQMPLHEEERAEALRKIKKRFSRKFLGLIKKGHFLKANQIRMQCKISWLEVFRCVI